MQTEQQQAKGTVLTTALAQRNQGSGTLGAARQR